MTSFARSPSRNGTRRTDREVTPAAIYVRKSTEHGLDQAFNSIDAQRAACIERIRREPGWQVVDKRYEDVATGANTDRPGYQHLLRDIEAGTVMAVCVYRGDRLTRSLLDLLRFIEFADQHGCVFVSATEPIETATIHGRLLTHTLSSYAEYERRLIAERTRDKVCASKRRGLWTGGHPVLGYDCVDKQLVPNADEAVAVNRLFGKMIECESVMSVVEFARQSGISNKSWVNKRGRFVQGPAFSADSMRRLLSNIVYRGLTKLGAEAHPGVHRAIVDEVAWKRVQALLTRRERHRQPRPGGRHDALLRGLLRCAACGSAMPHHFASKAGRRYGAYVCLKYTKEGAAACPGSRVAVGEIEGFVVDRIRAIGTDPGLVRETIATAKAQLAAAGPRIEAELRQVDADRERLDAERKNLVAAIGANGNGSASLVARVAEIDAAVTGLDRRAQELRGERAALEGQAIDEDDLRAAPAEFGELWNALAPAERSRLLHLLVEEVRFDGRTDEVEIRFRPGGMRGLADQARRNGE